LSGYSWLRFCHQCRRPGSGKGDRAPAKFQRPDAALKDWSKRGLKEPSKEAQWVKINDKYVMVQTTNGQITEIVPVTK
jgi:Ni/Co efflux regulator RcnB